MLQSKKALKKLTAVNGFIKSVLQCDGITTYASQPPHSHQSQGTVERFQKTLYGQVRAIRMIISEFVKIKWKVRFFLGSFNMQPIKSIATSSGQMEEPHTTRYSTSLRNHPLFISERAFLVTFSHNPRRRNCRFVHHLKSLSGCGWARTLSQACQPQ